MPIVGNTEQLLVIFLMSLIYKRKKRIQAEETNQSYIQKFLAIPGVLHDLNLSYI